MAKKTLWRAADDRFISGAASFAQRRQDAEAYLAGRNPGYGGSRLWRLSVDVDATSVLDLVGARDPIGRLCRIAGYEAEYHPGATGADEWVASSGSLRKALAAAGYLWVRVDESYPEDAVTWIWVGEDPTDIEDVMVEAG